MTLQQPGSPVRKERTTYQRELMCQLLALTGSHILLNIS